MKTIVLLSLAALCLSACELYAATPSPAEVQEVASV